MDFKFKEHKAVTLVVVGVLTWLISSILYGFSSLPKVFHNPLKIRFEISSMIMNGFIFTIIVLVVVYIVWGFKQKKTEILPKSK